MSEVEMTAEGKQVQCVVFPGSLLAELEKFSGIGGPKRNAVA